MEITSRIEELSEEKVQSINSLINSIASHDWMNEEVNLQLIVARAKMKVGAIVRKLQTDPEYKEQMKSELLEMASNGEDKPAPESEYGIVFDLLTDEFITKEEFIKRAQKVHGDKYDYSKVTPIVYIGE